MIHILYANSADIQGEMTLDELLVQLPNSFEKKAMRYKFAQDQFNYVLGRLMLKRGMEQLSVPLNRLENIQYNDFEKPLIDGISFSISHSQNLVACAFTTEGDIGLDVECPRAINKEHFNHCFNNKEWERIMADETLHTFYNYWTKKEAILKANGVGLDRLMDMEIHDNGTAHFLEKTSENTLWNWTHLDLGINNAYACLCADVKLEYKLKKLQL